MANIYLSTSDTNFKVSNNNSNVVGTSGTDSIIIDSGVTGVTEGSAIEVTNFAGNMSAYIFKQGFGSNLEVYTSAGVLVAKIVSMAGKSLAFSNGTVALADGTTGGITIGGTAVSAAAAAAVTPATINTALVSTAGSAAAAPTFTLTAGTDSFAGTGASETWTAATNTLQAADTIFDSSSSDSDTLNITQTAADSAVAATISNVENINLTNTAVTGAAFNATGVKGATITGTLTSALTLGDLEITTAGDNNVKAGAGVKDLTITGLKSGSVDLGSAETADIETAIVATGSTTVNALLTANGDIDLTLDMHLGTGTAVTAISATKDLTVTLTSYDEGGGTDNFVTSGTGVVTLSGDANDFSSFDSIKAGALTVSAGTDDVDMSAITLSTATVNVTSAAATLIEYKSGTVNMTADSASLTIEGKESTAGTNTATVNMSNAGLTGDTLVATDLASMTVNAASTASKIASLTYTGNTTLNIVADTTVTELVQGAETDKLTVVGSGAFTATADNDVTTLDASAVTGASTISVGNTDNDSTITTGVGNDTVILTGAETGADSKVVINFGAGTDTLKLADGVDLSVYNTLTLTALEAINLANDSGSAGVTMKAADISGKTYSMSAGTGTADALTLIVDNDATAVDLSTLTVASSLETFTVDAGDATQAVTFTGSTTGDEFTGADFASTISGGAGADDLTGGTAADSISGGTGNDAISSGDGADTLDGGDGDDTITAAASTASVVSILGGAGNDDITAGAGGGSITGGAGNDTITGAAGTDTIIVDAGTDTIDTFGAGASGAFDVVKVSAGATAKITASAAWTATSATENNGTAEITAAASSALDLSAATGSNGWKITAGGTAAAVIVGSANNDTMTSSGVADTLKGGAGDDILISKFDTAELTGGVGNDTFKAMDNDAVVTDLSGSDVIVTSGTKEVTATATAAWTATSATVLGSSAESTIATAGYNIDASLATATKGLVISGTGNTVMSLTGTSKADTIDGGNAADTISGGSGDDVLDGNAGADSITGGDGADTITGGEGNDVLTGGAGADIFVFEASAALNGSDTIVSFTAGTGEDVLEFDAMTAIAGDIFFAGAAYDANDNAVFAKTVLSDSTAVIDLATNIVFFDTSDYANITALTDVITGSGSAGVAFALDCDSEAIIVLGNLGSQSSTLYVYDVVAGDNDLETVTLIGTLTNVDATALVAANFTHA